MSQFGLKDVSVQFGTIKALNQVSMTCDEGEVLLLAGPNGAGKSTLIKVLLGLITPDNGHIMIDEMPTRVTQSYKSRIGYLPEAVAFAETLTGFQILKFFASARGVPKPKISAVLDQIGLQHAAKRPVRGYSKGMRQRLGLGVSILSDPDLLILDEPTGGLDQEGLKVLWELIDKWKSNKKTVLISSHDLTLMERRVTSIQLLKNGKSKFKGTPLELRDSAGLPLKVVFQLKNEARTFKEALERWERSCSLHFTNSEIILKIQPEHLMEIMDIKANYSNHIKHLRVEEPGLDSVYDHLILGETS